MLVDQKLAMLIEVRWKFASRVVSGSIAGSDMTQKQVYAHPVDPIMWLVAATVGYPKK